MNMKLIIHAFFLLQAILLVSADQKYIRAVNAYADRAGTSKLFCGLRQDLGGIIRSGAKRMMKYKPPLRGTTLKQQLEQPLRSRNLLDSETKDIVNQECAKSYLLLFSDDIKKELPKARTSKQLEKWVREKMAQIGEQDAGIIEHFIDTVRIYHTRVHNASPHEYEPSFRLSGGTHGASSSRTYGGGGAFGCFG